MKETAHYSPDWDNHSEKESLSRPKLTGDGKGGG